MKAAVIGSVSVLSRSHCGAGGFGERAGTRTRDLLIKSQLLYRLSYALVTMRNILSERPVLFPTGPRTSFLKIMREGRCRGACLPGQ